MSRGAPGPAGPDAGLPRAPTPASRCPRGRILGVNGIRLLGRRTGVGRSIEALLRALADLRHPFERIDVYTPAPLPGDVRLPAIARSVVLPSHLSLGLWEQLVLPRAHGQKQVLLSPSNVVPLLARCPTFLIHHGSYEGYPEAFPWWPRTKARLLYQASARRATRMATVSEHSKRDVVRFYGVPAEKVDVIPPGVDLDVFHPMADAERLATFRREVLGDDLPFLLYVGNPTRRRNLPALIQAFAALKREASLPHRLLLIGVRPDEPSIAPAVHELGLRREVVALPYAPHEEIALAYNAAEMLIYPSSYEGFGMPVLEAMACGTPAIALDRTSFPEFAGGVALLLSDATIETLKAGILELHRDAARRREMSRAGPERARRYEWHVIARRVLRHLVEMSA